MSSTVQASTYDWAVAVTKSDTVDDANGPFTGLYVSVAGTLICDNVNGPQGSNPITLIVVAGGYVCWPIKRIRTGTTATVFGLVSPIARQGFT